MEATEAIAALPLPPPGEKLVEQGDALPGGEETRAAAEATSGDVVVPPPAPPVEVKENRWKLAFRQLMFMKGMNMQVNDRNKNEIELRQQNISLRPGETLALLPADKLDDKKFFIVCSGSLAIAGADAVIARAVQQANLSPKFKLSVGDYFASHQLSNARVIAMEPVECLKLHMSVIATISETVVRDIEATNRDAGSETAETASFKHWALQYTLAMQRPAVTSQGFSSVAPKGFATNSVKQFSKDFLVHFSPENELDHTLEYMKLTLMGVFKARRVRMFIVDHESSKLVVKFSDDQLSQGSLELERSIAQKVLEKREGIYTPAMAPYLEGETADVKVLKELYKPTDRVIATPMFEFDPMQSPNGGEASQIVAVLEVVMDNSTPMTGAASPSELAATASENDIQILEVATQELGRYLYFHYQDFFAIALKKGTGVNQSAQVTEVFPAPDISDGDQTFSLTLNQLTLNREVASATHAVVSICHGKVPLISNKVRVRPQSPTRAKSATQAFLFDSSVEFGVSLGDIPHGSHILVQLYTKTSLLAWSGIHIFDFGHGLRVGTLDLDVSNSLAACITALDIENCAKPQRTNKKNIVGSLSLSLECSGTGQGFSFSSLPLKPKRSITYRASTFGNKRASKIVQLDQTTVNSYEAEQQKLLSRLRRDPLAQLSSDDRGFVWDCRHSLSEDSALLPAFLLSVDWGKRDQVMEAYRMLILWRQPTYLQALQLLSPMFTDPKIRAYAVRCMHSLPDHRLRLYLLQLVQALKNERYHDSALARFLIMRALQNPAEMGYSLYWLLKAEVHIDQTSERFGLILGEYMELCGSYKLEIRQSVFVMKKLEEIAVVVKNERTPVARRARLHELLRAVVLPETFQLPLHPREYCNGIIVEPCRVMESKKRPLFLQLESTKAQHGSPFVIFKSGDDLRQDQLVLQILRVMDDLWREAGLDLCLSPYACISTGHEIGLIEVVGDSSTLASIIYDRHQGSMTKLTRKFKSAKDALVGNHVLSEWLFADENGASIDHRHSAGVLESEPGPVAEYTSDLSCPSPTSGASSPTGSPIKRPASKSSGATEDATPTADKVTPKGCLSPSRLFKKSPQKSLTRDNDATETFLRSCAGYCVATYVLGIGDRHNDNIMLQRSGKFFHIDFGHFLGNFKSKFGIKREKAPFVFTPAMRHVIDVDGSGNYTKFEETACQAFQILRTNSNLLITLLVLALTCGTPELTCEDDIQWVHSTLMLELSDEDAATKFRKLIDVALHTTTTLVNDAVHLMAH